MQIDQERTEIAAEVWRSVIEYIPFRDRETAAEQLISVLRSLNFSDEDIQSLAEHDQHIHAVLELEAEEEAYYDEAESDDEDEDDLY